MVDTVPLARLRHSLVAEALPTEQPWVVEVIIPFSTGTVDEAVAQTRDLIAPAVETALAAALASALDAAQRQSLVNAIVFG